METDRETEGASAIALLTADAIRGWTGARSFELGKRAFRTGALSSPRVEHAVLRARCQGSAALPYRVEVTLAPQGIESAHCTCGKGAEGKCKHTAALLVAWLEQPNLFEEAEPIDATLERLSPQSLLTLLRRVSRRSEDVADLIEQELPYVAGAVASAEQVNVEALRREVSIALGAQRRPHYDDWAESGAQHDDESAASSQRLRPIFELAEDYLARSRYALAATVYRAIVESTIEAAGGDTGATFPETINATLRACAAGLGGCLDGSAAVGLRRTILQILVEIAIADETAVATDTALFAKDLLTARTTSAERDEIAAFIARQPPRDSAEHVAGEDRSGALLAHLKAPADGASRHSAG